MDPTTYQQLAQRTECDQEAARKRYTALMAVRLNHAVMGLMGEVGELAGALEKWLHYGRDLDRVNLAEEVGDCLWYLSLLCNAADLYLGTIMQANIAKLKVRYPEKYTDTAATERDPEAERAALVQNGHGWAETPLNEEGN